MFMKSLICKYFVNKIYDIIRLEQLVYIYTKRRVVFLSVKNLRIGKLGASVPDTIKVTFSCGQQFIIEYSGENWYIVHYANA